MRLNGIVLDKQWSCDAYLEGSVGIHQVDRFWRDSRGILRMSLVEVLCGQGYM